jgi:hypothetical protein
MRFENAFNPYSDTCPVHDVADAPVQRSHFLGQMLEAASTADVDAIWIGRDLGYRGGRRTGLALTDDVHFGSHLSRWGISNRRPTTGKPVPERTAAAVWDLLDRIACPVFLWNVFPLHPHLPEDWFSNRMHNAGERRAGIEVLSQLVEMLQPQRLIAVGNDAERAALEIASDAKIIKVRHPSYGGQTEFSRQIRELYNIPDNLLL